MSIILLTLAILLISASKKINKNISKLKIKHNIQDGNITYSDLNITAETLFSNRYRISGKPDYVIKKNDHYIPIEVKTGYHHKPKKNHIFQLVAYCQIIEENYDMKSFWSHRN